MRRSHALIILTFLAALGLAACAGSATPALIGAYRADSAPPIATYIPPPSTDGVLVYNATLDLTVRDVTAAADAAARLAADAGGYLSGSQSWYVNDDLHTTLTLVVPSDEFEAIHAGLLRLGTLNTAYVSGDPITTPAGRWDTSSAITVSLSPAPPLFDLPVPSLPDTGWRPGRTFAAAFSVFATLFTALVDAAIWLAVVVGPFVLLAYGLRRLLRPARPVVPSSEEKKE